MEEQTQTIRIPFRQAIGGQWAGPPVKPEMTVTAYPSSSVTEEDRMRAAGYTRVSGNIAGKPWIGATWQKVEAPIQIVAVQPVAVTPVAQVQAAPVSEAKAVNLIVTGTPQVQAQATQEVKQYTPADLSSSRVESELRKYAEQQGFSTAQTASLVESEAPQAILARREQERLLETRLKTPVPAAQIAGKPVEEIGFWGGAPGKSANIPSWLAGGKVIGETGEGRWKKYQIVGKTGEDVYTVDVYGIVAAPTAKYSSLELTPAPVAKAISTPPQAVGGIFGELGGTKTPKAYASEEMELNAFLGKNLEFKVAEKTPFVDAQGNTITERYITHKYSPSQKYAESIANIPVMLTGGSGALMEANLFAAQGTASTIPTPQVLPSAVAATTAISLENTFGYKPLPPTQNEINYNQKLSGEMSDLFEGGIYQSTSAVRTLFSSKGLTELLPATIERVREKGFSNIPSVKEVKIIAERNLELKQLEQEHGAFGAFAREYAGQFFDYGSPVREAVFFAGAGAALGGAGAFIAPTIARTGTGIAAMQFATANPNLIKGIGTVAAVGFTAIPPILTYEGELKKGTSEPEAFGKAGAELTKNTIGIIAFGKGFEEGLKSPLKFEYADIPIARKEVANPAYADWLKTGKKGGSPAKTIEEITTKNIYKGVVIEKEGEASFLFGKAESGKWVTGVPKTSEMPSLQKIDLPIFKEGAKAEYMPATSIETELISRGLNLNKAQAVKMSIIREELQFGKELPSAFQGDLPLRTAKLSEAQTKAVVKSLQEAAAKGQVERGYGTFFATSQTAPKYQTPTSDIDVNFVSKTAAEAQAVKDLKILQKMGVNAKLAPNKLTILPTTGEGHILDYHYPGMDDLQAVIPSAKQYGFTVTHPTITLQGIPQATLAEQQVRVTTASGFLWKSPTGEIIIEPAAHRAKDVVRAYAVGKSQTESAKILGLRSPKQIFKSEKLLEQWRGLEWKTPGVAEKFAELDAGIMQFELQFAKPATQSAASLVSSGVASASVALPKLFSSVSLSSTSVKQPSPSLFSVASSKNGKTTPSVSPFAVSKSIAPSPSLYKRVYTSISPSVSPSISPFASPSISPSPSRSPSPSVSPSISPSFSASVSEIISPNLSPSPSSRPLKSPFPSISPSVSPSISPFASPSISPSKSPSISPIPSRSPSPSIKFPPPSLIPRGLFLPQIFGGSRLQRTQRITSRQQKKYQADFTSIIFGIRGKAKQGILSGFELRPIPFETNGKKQFNLKTARTAKKNKFKNNFGGLL